MMTYNKLNLKVKNKYLVKRKLILRINKIYHIIKKIQQQINHVGNKKK